MLQVIYKWKGIPVQHDDGPVTYNWVHLPQETQGNTYSHTEPDNYVGDVHTNVDNINVETVTRWNNKEIDRRTSNKHICRDCGATSWEDR